MKSLWLEQKLNYDGGQLKSLFAYENHGLLGDSIVAFRGDCKIHFDQMVDLEDVRDQSKIEGSDMVHFILEVFQDSLWGAVALQRLMASICGDVVAQLSAGKYLLRRDGDDLFWGEKKFSISIASRSSVSCMIHFAVNVSNKGTPVPTCALIDFAIDPQVFARTVLAKVSHECQTIKEATQKVRPLK